MFSVHSGAIAWTKWTILAVIVILWFNDDDVKKGFYTKGSGKEAFSFFKQM